MGYDGLANQLDKVCFVAVRNLWLTKNAIEWSCLEEIKASSHQYSDLVRRQGLMHDNRLSAVME